ncbi:family 43 glycosylhydrolase [Anthropogastromicrobium sp.]|uniref:glycoside hydrolase family 43 protein n=1 Tax=Anthropogastromicrobium sp. TaxID=2981649 RepID=UPI00307B7A0D
MKYQNPIIRGFHPDPSICRVGSDYYLVTSTFEYFPGIALFHSRDLVNWKQIGNCITRPGQLDYAKFKDSGGVWAPTIRCYKGRFYVTAAIDGMGNMIMHTDDINGEWSAPVWTDFGGIDPSICFDEDEAYYCTNDFTNGHEAIVLAKIDPDTGIRKEECREIWNGTGGGWLESPHVYHIGDYYYILAAEGGTNYTHMETAARSKNIYGPYENCPYNPVLTNRNDTTKQIQCAGHADLIDDENGNWWMVHLGTRSVLKSKTPLGRETFLTPVEWKEGWPVAVNRRAKLENELDRIVCRTKKENAQNKNAYGQIETERNIHIGNSFHFKPNFSVSSWEPQWLWLREPDITLYERKSNALILHPSAFDFKAPAQPCFVGICQPDIDCHFQTTFTFEPKDGEEGGMLLYLSSNFYYRICKRKQKGKTQLAVIRKLDDVEVTDYVKELESTESPITIYINASAVGYHITWKTEDKVLEDAGTYSLRFLCTEIENRCFTGTIIGIYAADHTIIQRKTSEQDKKQETLKTQRRSSSMTITNFEASVC